MKVENSVCVDILKTLVTPVKCETDEQTAFDKRGLKNTKSGGYTINGNTFAQYVLENRMKLVRLSNDVYYAYSPSKGYYIEIDETELKAICRDIVNEASSKEKIWMPKWERDYFKALTYDIPRVDEMNPDKLFINLKNGMLNLKTRKLVEHDPNFLSTIQIPYEYDQNADCPQFLGFLNQVFENDQERINLIQEIFGNMFLPKIMLQKGVFFLGNGSNGKSVMIEIMQHLVGVQNVSNTPLKAFTEKFGLEDLPDKLVNIASETEFGKRNFNTETFKQITSGDKVQIQRKYKKPINTELSAKTVIVINSMMDTSDLTDGFFRRLMIIPFKQTFKELKAGQTPVEGLKYQDPELKGKLLKELPGILNWALDGLARLTDNGYRLSESRICDEALEHYRISQDPITEYVKARVVPGNSSNVILRSAVRNDFVNWCLRNGFDEAKGTNCNKFLARFTAILGTMEIHFTEVKRRGDYYIKGINLKDLWNEEEAS